ESPNQLWSARICASESQQRRLAPLPLNRGEKSKNESHDPIASRDDRPDPLRLGARHLSAACNRPLERRSLCRRLSSIARVTPCEFHRRRRPGGLLFRPKICPGGGSQLRLRAALQHPVYQRIYEHE